MAVLTVAASVARAATFTVTTVDDAGSGSLREAIASANASPGADRIVFAIAGAGPHTISPLSELPTFSEAVSIDGYTQTGARPNTLAAGSDAVLAIELSGTFAGATARGLSFNGFARGSVVRGLVVNGFGGTGIEVGPNIANVVVAGCYVGTDLSGTQARPNLRGVTFSSCNDCTVGGESPGDRNVISGNLGQGIRGEYGGRHLILGNHIGVDATGRVALGNLTGVEFRSGFDNEIGRASAATRNIISGNRSDGVHLFDPIAIPGRVVLVRGNFIGTDATGEAAIPNGDTGIRLEQDHAIIGGRSASEANLISGNTVGLRLGGTAARVEGNWIGTDAAGLSAIGNTNGIVFTATDGIVGGTAPGAGNVISGNTTGIVVAGSGPTRTIAGNVIGLAADRETPLPNTYGLRLPNDPEIVVGGTVPEAGNVIAGNLDAGILLVPSARRPVIRANAIFANGALGIDHGGDGVTPNDLLDADMTTTGPQNYPVLSSAAAGVSETNISGTLDSLPGQFYAVDIYVSDACDPSGYGEGRRWVASTEVTTDAAGHATFATVVPEALQGLWLTALATGSSTGTSEFSACLRVNRPPVASAGSDVVAECIDGAADVILDGSGSYDPDGNLLSYLWTEGASTLASTATAAVSFPLGAHPVTLQVTDPYGASSTDGLNVSVVDGRPPALTCPAEVVASQTAPGGASVQFTVTADDACEGPVSPDCSPASGAFFALGSTTVACTAADSGGRTSACSFPVIVSPPASTPSVRVTGSGTVASSGAKATFSVQLTTDATGAVSGSFTLYDQPRKWRITSTRVSALVITGNRARAFGFASVNGAAPIGFQLDLGDLARPGRTGDTFGLSLAQGYSIAGAVRSGEIRLDAMPNALSRGSKR